MSLIEDDASEFLKKIVRTLSAALAWLLVNVTIGIYFDWMFFNGSPSIGNIIFYCWLAVSLAALLRYLYIVWKKYISK